MRAAVACENDRVAPHFGRCKEYVIIDFDGGRLVGKSVLPSPGHQPGLLPLFLEEYGIEFLIAGGMGGRAQEIFSNKNIEVILGVAGPIDEIIEGFISGEITAGDKNNFCTGGGEKHCELE